MAGSPGIEEVAAVIFHASVYLVCAIIGFLNWRKQQLDYSLQLA